MQSIIKPVAMAVIASVIAGCTVHPRGESTERAVAVDAGKSYVHPVEEREPPRLSADATPDQLVAYALLTNADLERQYWVWRSALEQIPQEGTQKTSLMITFNSMISNGTTAAALNTLGFGNDAMNNIVLPGKLETAAKVALDQARAQGKRFDQARFELRSKVIVTYADYALTAELIRLEQANTDLISLTANANESRIATGGAKQQDLLKISNELELSRNELAVQKAKLSAQLAALNAFLNRDPDALINMPSTLPDPQPLMSDDAQILHAAVQNNPELQALAQEIAAKHETIARAKQEYQPEFGVNISTGLAGVTQSLMGSVMLPVLRYQAIDAGIRQAEVNLRAAEAMRTQASHDVASRIVADLALIHDLDRQIVLYENATLPRSERVITATQNSYAAGQNSLIDLLDAQRSLIALRRIRADFVTSRTKQLADLEAATAMNLSNEHD